MDLGNDRVAATADAAALDVLRSAIPDVYRYAIRLTGGNRWLAEDLVQEASVALVRRAQADPAYEFSVGWLIVVVRRRYLDHVRSSQRDDRRVASSQDGSSRSEEADWSSASADQALRMLADLPADQRVALVLRYVDDLPVRDVAEQMNRTVAATESLLARGRRELAHRVKGAVDG